MILGIDPGLANTGWAILDDRSSIVDLPAGKASRRNNSEYELVECGCLRTKITSTSAKRLNMIYEELEGLIKRYGVTVIAFESLFFAKNAKSALKVAEAIGVIKICGERNKVEVVEFTPLQIKMALVGYGRAEKEQVEEMVRRLLNLEENISPSHASDAVAAGLTYLFTNKSLI